MAKGLYEAVLKNQYGFYELKEQYRKQMSNFYRDEYYQNEHALYQCADYDPLDIEQKNHFYSRKVAEISRLAGGGYI